jgi:hypothetical protein
MFRIITCVASLATLWTFSSVGSAATFDFESVPLATRYSVADGYSPGDTVLSNWDVKMTVEEFTQGAFTGFNFSEISGHPGPPTSFFPVGVNPSQSLTINNMNVKFDFTAVPFDVTGVTLDYVDLGGSENFDLNGLGRQEVGALSSLAAIPGYSITVTENPIGGGVTGTVKVEALPGNRIDTLLVGGQEFGIDNVEKVPEPTSWILATLAGLAFVGYRKRHKESNHS